MANKKNEIKPWEEVSREVMFEKFGRGIEKVLFRQSDGEEYDVYVKKEAVSVAVVALTKDRQVILTRQFRPGPKKVLYELPGGGLIKGKSLQESMEQELLEETGYQGKMKFVTSLVDCGYSTRVKNCFVATDCEKVEDIAGDLHDDDGDARGFKEEIEVELVSLKEFRELLRGGQNSDIEIGYLGLDYLGLLGGDSSDK